MQTSQRESLYKAQGEQKHHYDNKTKNRQLNVGVKVLVLLPIEHKKLISQWRGPYVVKEVINRMDYKVEVKGKRLRFTLPTC